VTFIRPISAVTAEPARLANSSARDHRPELAQQRQGHHHPQGVGRPVALQDVVALQPSTSPTKSPDTRMISSDSTPLK
jgi:hypothetical protein